MKTKGTYVSLVVGVLLLIGVAVVLSGILFKLSVPDRNVQAVKTRPAQPEEPRAVGEITIPVGPEEPVAEPEPSPAPGPVAGREVPPNVVTRRPDPQPVRLVSPRKAGKGIGEATVVRGEVHLLDTAMRRRSIIPGTRISLQDTIETGAASRLVIKLDDGTSISQGEKSVVIIDEYFCSPNDKEKTRFAMRFVQGVCRVVSGLITDINPRRFKVHTRMTTIGIRGCELAFRTRVDRDDIYILGLSDQEYVRIDTTKDGRTIMNVSTGKVLPPDNAVKTFIEVRETGTRVSVVRGKGVEKAKISGGELRDLKGETSHLAPARYDMLQKPDGAVLTIQPRSQPPSDTPGTAQ